MSYPATCLDGADEFCAHCDDVFTEDCADASHERVVTDADFEWVVCDRCRGEGTLGGYPGVYTSDDFAEDPDFAEDYMNHRRTCEDCGGRTTVRVLSADALTRPAVAAWIKEMNEMYAIAASERRMGS